MVKAHRTPAEQKLWDAVVTQLAAVCTEIKGTEGCAHLIREIADAVIRERRESIREDK